MRYDFHPEARLEYREAAAFYQTRRPGLGAAFSLQVEATIERRLERPERFRILEADVRTCRTRTFPYAILNTIESEFIFIIAVMHLRRKPGYFSVRGAHAPRVLCSAPRRTRLPVGEGADRCSRGGCAPPR